MTQQLHYIQQAKTSILLVEDDYYERFIQDCEQYSHYVSLIPESFRNSIHHLNIMRDMYFALLVDEHFLFNPNFSMIYVLRYTIITELVKLPKFQMLHAICVRDPHVTLLVAILILIATDEEFAAIVNEQDDIQFAESFAFIAQFPSLDILVLYDEQRDLQNTYPKQLAKAQAIMANLFRSAIRQAPPRFQKRFQSIATCAQYYTALRK